MFPRAQAAGPRSSRDFRLRVLELLAAALDLLRGVSGRALGLREGLLRGRPFALGGGGGLLGVAERGLRGLDALLRRLLALGLGLALGGRALTLGGAIVVGCGLLLLLRGG